MSLFGKPKPILQVFNEAGDLIHSLIVSKNGFIHLGRHSQPKKHPLIESLKHEGSIVLTKDTTSRSHGAITFVKDEGGNFAFSIADLDSAHGISARFKPPTGNPREDMQRTVFGVGRKPLPIPDYAELTLRGFGRIENWPRGREPERLRVRVFRPNCPGYEDALKLHKGFARR